MPRPVRSGTSLLQSRRWGSVAPATACVLRLIEAEAVELPSRDVEAPEFRGSGSYELSRRVAGEAVSRLRLRLRAIPSRILVERVALEFVGQQQALAGCSCEEGGSAEATVPAIWCSLESTSLVQAPELRRAARNRTQPDGDHRDRTAGRQHGDLGSDDAADPRA
jgi:hypothetical protein